MLHVVAMIEVAEGKREDFLAEFRKIVPLVLDEEGCIEYGPTVEIDTGNEKIQAPDAQRVTVIEKWESLDHLNAHLVAPHMLEYREKVKDFVVGAKVYVSEPA
ncbi:MAG: putative quinol monooxygenase [Planctomycetota bacterium]